MQVIEHVRDRYLTWRTGLNKQEREWRQWQEQTIVHRASTIEGMFVNFKYIIPVSTQIFNSAEPFGWVPNKDFQQYTYPMRDLDNCAVYHFARGIRDQWGSKFNFNELSGDDQVFVATNNKEDAMMIALKWS